MDTLTSWFEAQSARERRAVLLEDALLGNRFAPYFVYRLRFFFLRYAVATGVQLLKVLLLHRLLGQPGFISLVAVVAVAGLVSAAWWGALEVLRARVRRLYRFESATAVSREIARWVSASLRVSVVMAGLVVALGVAASVLSGGIPGPAEVAIAAVLLRAGFDLPIRAYHAGAFAVRRVYRPWFTIIGLEGLGLATMVLLVPVLGAYSVAAGEVVMALAFGLISLRYASRTFRLLGFAPGSLVTLRPRALRRGSRQRVLGGVATVREVAGPAAAGFSMGLDSIVILAMVGVANTSPGEAWLAVLFAAIVPTVRAGFDWPQLVYFDLKRLDAPLFVNLRRRLDRATLRLALVLGAGFSFVGLAVAVGPLGLRKSWLVGLPPFLLAASLLGLSEMQAFAAGAYRRVMLGGVVLVVGLLGLRPAADLFIQPIAVLAVATLAAAVVVRAAARLDIAKGGDVDPLLPAAWLGRLTATAGPVRIGAVRVRGGEAGRWARDLAGPAAAQDWRAQQLARRLAGRIAAAGAVTVVGGERVAWFEPGAGPRRVDRRRAVMEASGRVTDLLEADVPSGQAAIGAIGTWGVFRLPVGVSPGEAEGPAMDSGALAPDGLEESFRRLVPGGLVYSPDRPAPPALERLAAADRRLILWEAIRYAQSLSTRPGRGAWDVTAWCPDGSLGLLFIAPRAAGHRRIVRWRRLLRTATLAAASGGALSRTDMLPESARGARPAALAASVATSLRHG